MSTYCLSDCARQLLGMGTRIWDTLWVLLLVSCMVVQAEETGNVAAARSCLKATLNTPSEVYRMGEPIMVWLELSNTCSTETYYVDLSSVTGVYVHAHLILKLKNGAGVEQPLISPFIDLYSSAEDTRVLKPGQRIAFCLGDIVDTNSLQHWNLSPGKYTFGGKYLNSYFGLNYGDLMSAVVEAKEVAFSIVPAIEGEVRGQPPK